MALSKNPTPSEVVNEIINLGIYTDNRGVSVRPDDIVENDPLVYTYDSTDYTAEVTQDSSYGSLTDVVIPKYTKNSSDGNWYKVTGIGDGAFSNETNLRFAAISDSVTSIGEESFYGCSGLMRITIPDSVISIGERAFMSASSLTTVVIGENAQTIGDAAFAGDTYLESINLPNGMTHIGNLIFDGCEHLLSIIIGANVTAISSVAFRSCIDLTSITILRDDDSTISGAPWGATNATVTYYRRVSDSQITAWDAKADISDIPTFELDGTVLTIHVPS